MSSLQQESTIMSSNDGSITLTTHRLLQRTRKINGEIMLADFVSYQQIKKRSTYYAILSIFFFVIAFSFFVLYKVKVNEAENIQGRFTLAFRDFLHEQEFLYQQIKAFGTVAAVAAGLCVIALILYLIPSNKYLRVVGKYNSIEFSTKHLRDESYTKFTNALVTESDKRKRE